MYAKFYATATKFFAPGHSQHGTPVLVVAGPVQCGPMSYVQVRGLHPRPIWVPQQNIR